MEQKNTVEYLLQHLAATINRQIDQAMQEKIGIGLAQFKILQSLESNPAVRQYQIAAALGQTEASVSRQVKLLIDKGLLTSQISPKDRRERINVPTAKGLKMVGASDTAMRQYIDARFAGIGDKRQKQLVELLSILHAQVCQPTKTATCQHLFDEKS